MLEYLRTVFGEKVEESSYQFSGMPLYITDEYKPSLYSINGISFLTITPHSKLSLPTLKKHCHYIRSKINMPCVLDLYHITSSQRKSLIEDGIPFVARGTQVYLPFLGCSLTESYHKATEVPKLMSPSTQYAFLYLYYYFSQPESTSLKMIDASTNMLISKAGLTRAMKDFTESGYLDIIQSGREKWIQKPDNINDMLKMAMSRMQSPIEKIVYIKTAPDMSLCQYSSILALSKQSMLAAKENDAGYAISKENFGKIKSELIVSEEHFRDFGGHPMEVWKYNPRMLSNTKCVDDISLLLILKDDPDERIQNVLDEIRDKHGLAE